MLFLGFFEKVLILTNEKTVFKHVTLELSLSLPPIRFITIKHFTKTCSKTKRKKLEHFDINKDNA